MLKQKVGKLGEDIAERYLKSKGLKIISRNFRKNFGELDIIAKQGEEIVFIEVKTRREVGQTMFGSPERAVNRRKINKISNTAQSFLEKRGYVLDKVKWRIDVLAIKLNWKTRMANIKHIKNVI